MRFGWKSWNIVQPLNSKRAKKENLGEEMLKMDVHGSKGKTNVKSFKLLSFSRQFLAFHKSKGVVDWSSLAWKG